MASVPQEQSNDALKLIIVQNETQPASQIFLNEHFANSPEAVRTVESDDYVDEVKDEPQSQGWFEQPVKNEADTQTLFDNAVKKALNIPSGYEKVAVLVVRWDESVDDPQFRAGHDEEVRVKRLQTVFKERFHFDVSSEVRLTTTKKPQNILNKAITDHIDTFDGPNNLLIVYYTGHGGLVSTTEGKERLQLAATSKSHQDNKSPWPASAIWCQAEKPLMEAAEADVLTLLDCCYAGSAHKGADGECRTYELLAACHKNGRTKGPGPNSFTTRLLDALERLLDKPQHRPITMTRLADTIITCDGHGVSPPYLLDRLDDHLGRHVQLAPVNKRSKQENEAFQQRPREKSVVKMRFSLEVDVLSPDLIERWARELAKMHRKEKIPVRRIDWMRVGRRQTSKRWQDVMKHIQMENKKRKSAPGGSPPADVSPTTRKRMREGLSVPEDTPDPGPLTPASME
ncbi:hypothetical protein N0V94_005623 [Neodidymelliopsis sp. IMI 364377]|nr:hypothetical protein N0V94_005623 [Neodidymelliopsis sp. IMI 364377]